MALISLFFIVTLLCLYVDGNFSEFEKDIIQKARQLQPKLKAKYKSFAEHVIPEKLQRLHEGSTSDGTNVNIYIPVPEDNNINLAGIVYFTYFEYATALKSLLVLARKMKAYEQKLYTDSQADLDLLAEAYAMRKVVDKLGEKMVELLENQKENKVMGKIPFWKRPAAIAEVFNMIKLFQHDMSEMNQIKHELYKEFDEKFKLNESASEEAKKKTADNSEHVIYGIKLSIAFGLVENTDDLWENP